MLNHLEYIVLTVTLESLADLTFTASSFLHM